MELFLKAYFCIKIVKLILNVLALGFVDYPIEINRELHAISFIISIPFAFWAATLIWM